MFFLFSRFVQDTNRCPARHKPRTLALYNSDIIKDIHTNIRSFPDTSILIIIVKDLVTSVDRLNEDLAKLLKNGRTLADVVYSTVTESRIICRKINTHLYMNTHIYLKLNAQA